MDPALPATPAESVVAIVVEVVDCVVVVACGATVLGPARGALIIVWP